MVYRTVLELLVSRGLQYKFFPQQVLYPYLHFFPSFTHLKLFFAMLPKKFLDLTEGAPTMVKVVGLYHKTTYIVIERNTILKSV